MFNVDLIAIVVNVAPVPVVLFGER